MSRIEAPQSYAGVLTPDTHECDIIWKQGLCRCNQSKMKAFGWILIQYGRCPYEKEKFGHGCTQGGDPCVKTQTQTEGGHTKTETVIGVMLAPASETLELPEAGIGKKDFCLEVEEEAWPC